MVSHDHGDYLVLAFELVSQRRDGLLRFTYQTGVELFAKCGGSILKESLLPLVELGRMDSVPFARLRDGARLQQMLAQDFDLFLRIVPSVFRILLIHAAFPMSGKVAKFNSPKMSFRLKRHIVHHSIIRLVFNSEHHNWA